MPYLIGRYSLSAEGAPGEVHDSQLNALGKEAVGNDGITYVYLQGVASTAVGSVVTFNTAGATALIAANAIGPVAVATAAVVANKFGWYVRDTGASSCSAMVAANSLASANVGRETADGQVGDGRATGDQINGFFAAANATGGALLTAGCRCWRPYVDDASGA